MCRLFGFRSVILSQVHSSLVDADNALLAQSPKHPDGWGVAYYVNGAPHIVKSANAALNCNIFKKVSGVVSSNTVLAHIRNTTIGDKNILNTHPFQFGQWTFAHNGNIKNFDQFRDQLLARVSPTFKRFVLGETDSEVLFYYFLSFLETKFDLTDRSIPIRQLSDALREALSNLLKIIGPYSQVDDAGDSETYITFILTNGETMIAHQGGKNLYYSTYKNTCKDRDICPSYSPECEAATKTGIVNHLIFSSEPLSGDNIWIPLNSGQIIGVDSQMKLCLC